jgi:hypothetical protein
MSFLGVIPTDALALVEPATGERMTYADLVSRGHAIAAALGSGKALALVVTRNDAFTAASYWGALDAGHAVGLLDGHAAPETTASLTETYRPTWLAGRPGLGELLAGLGVPVDSTRRIAGGELVRTAFAGS